MVLFTRIKKATLKDKVNEFKKATQDFGYKFDLKNDIDFSDIEKASNNHNQQVEYQKSFETEINDLTAAIKLHNESIQHFETLRDKKLKEYGLDTLNFTVASEVNNSFPEANKGAPTQLTFLKTAHFPVPVLSLSNLL